MARRISGPTLSNNFLSFQIQTHTFVLRNMAARFIIALSLLLLLFSLAQVSSNAKTEAHQTQIQVVKGPNRRLLPFMDCAGMCGMRCSEHSRPNVCTRACGTCCARCKCVPPGTSGNREACGRCYTDMTTHGNKPKCP